MPSDPRRSRAPCPRHSSEGSSCRNRCGKVATRRVGFARSESRIAEAQVKRCATAVVVRHPPACTTRALRRLAVKGTAEASRCVQRGQRTWLGGALMDESTVKGTHLSDALRRCVPSPGPPVPQLSFTCRLSPFRAKRRLPTLLTNGRCAFDTTPSTMPSGRTSP